MKKSTICIPWVAAAVVLCAASVYSRIPITHGSTPLPSSVDNGVKRFFRPVFEQMGESCGNANGIGYTFTYEMDCARDAAADVEGNQYPYVYTYDFLNDGSSSNGTSHMYVDALNIVKENGVPTVADWGGLDAGFPTKWMSGYDAYYKAMRNRVDKIDTIDMLDSNGLTSLKQWLYDHGNGSASGGVANLGCSVGGWQFSTIATGPQTGKSICIKYGTDPAYEHAQTIVGYNDSIRYDFNKDGKYTDTIDQNNDGKATMADWEIGALRIVNSWGVNSGIGDSDRYWLPYRLLVTPQTQGGIWNANRVCIVTVKNNYAPKMTLKASLTHGQRNRIALSVGVAPQQSATQPVKVREFAKQFTYAGGAFPLCGSGGSSTSERGLDITDLIDSLAGGDNATFFLVVQSKGGAGTVNSLSLMDYTSGAVKETKSALTNVSISTTEKTYIGVSTAVSEVAWSPVRTAEPPDFVFRRINGAVQVKGPWRRVKYILIFTMNGAQKSSLPSNPRDGWVTLPSALPSGMYIVRFLDDDGRNWTRKAPIN
jgi:hypothetical protein